jgi:hypothetical protein
MPERTATHLQRLTDTLDAPVSHTPVVSHVRKRRHLRSHDRQRPIATALSPFTEDSSAALQSDIAIEFLATESNKVPRTESKIPHAIEILVQCLHRYVEAHPERFQIQETETPACRIKTVTLNKE